MNYIYVYKKGGQVKCMISLLNNNNKISTNFMFKKNQYKYP